MSIFILVIIIYSVVSYKLLFFKRVFMGKNIIIENGKI